MRDAAFPLLCIVVIVIGLPALGAEKRVIAPPGPKPIGPYSPGILAGDFLYVSGQGGRDAEGKLPARSKARCARHYRTSRPSWKRPG